MWSSLVMVLVLCQLHDIVHCATLQEEAREKSDEPSLRLSDAADQQTAMVYEESTVYYFITIQKQWKDAKAYCENMGTTLAIITTVKEQKRLMNILLARYHNLPNWWVGSKRNAGEKEWHWLSGEPIPTSPLLWHNTAYEGNGCLK